MGIVKKTKNVVNIWPWAIWYVIIVFVIGGGFILLMNIAPILIVIFENEPLEIFGHSLHNSWLLVFTMPIALILDYLFFKAVLWKVSFTKTHIIVPRIPEIQEKKIELACNEILTCEVTMVGFNYYFMFSCLDGKKRKMSIIRFSFKQLETILKMIQERGGMVDQNIDEIINPLRIRKH
jgi:hypothetical protein